MMAPDRRVLLNPGPVTTTDTVKRAQVVSDTCPREREFRDLMGRVRDHLIGVVEGGSEYVAVIFESSGTGAVEACISSVVPRDRKLLILSNGGYGDRMAEIGQAYELDVLQYRIPWGRPLDKKSIECLLQRHRGQVSHVALVHHETTTGMLNDLAEFTRLAHEYNAEVVVDAISSYAGLPIGIAELGVDYLVGSSSKCLQAMPGLSFVICRREHVEGQPRGGPRSYYLDLYSQHRFFEEQSGVRFTAPVQAFCALDQALIEFFEETGAGRHRRYLRNHTEMVEGLRRLGFRFLLPPEQRSCLMIAVIEPTNPAYSYDEMHDYMRSRGFVIYPERYSAPGAFRLANMGEIEARDIRAFLRALEAFLEEKSLGGDLYEAH